MKNTSNHHMAQALIGLMILAIGFVLFYKLATNETAFANDMYALRNYAALSIVTMGFLLGLFYLATKSHTSTKPSKKKKK